MIYHGCYWRAMVDFVGPDTPGIKPDDWARAFIRLAAIARLSTGRLKPQNINAIPFVGDGGYKMLLAHVLAGFFQPEPVKVARCMVEK
jgi:hypothetical protein